MCAIQCLDVVTCWALTCCLTASALGATPCMKVHIHGRRYPANYHESAPALHWCKCPLNSNSLHLTLPNMQQCLILHLQQKLSAGLQQLPLRAQRMTWTCSCGSFCALSMCCLQLAGKVQQYYIDSGLSAAERPLINREHKPSNFNIDSKCPA